jgi:hypothetical protein
VHVFALYAGQAIFLVFLSYILPEL